MIFLITGRIGTGTQHFTEKMQQVGYIDTLPELTKLDGQPIPKSDMPRYAAADPNLIMQILQHYPDEIFHVIYIKTDEDDDNTRKDWYISEHDDSDAETVFDRRDAEESAMFDDFENTIKLQAVDIRSLHAAHTITNNFDDTTQQEWVDYFIKFHRMYTRIVGMVKLGMKTGAIRTTEDDKVVLFYRSENGQPPRKELMTPECFGDILLTDNEGLAMLTRGVLEDATIADLTDALS